jgi:diaminopimelate epimerase
LNTGSPHHIEIKEDLENLNIKNLGSKIRYSDLYGKSGSNVNFAKQISKNEFSIRTYERGVEDETLSCGTGATAVAIAMNATGKTDENKININVKGGKLEVSFEKENGIYKNVFLKGKAEFVYFGEILL